MSVADGRRMMPRPIVSDHGAQLIGIAGVSLAFALLFFGMLTFWAGEELRAELNEPCRVEYRTRVIEHHCPIALCPND